MTPERRFRHFLNVVAFAVAAAGCRSQGTAQDSAGTDAPASADASDDVLLDAQDEEDAATEDLWSQCAHAPIVERCRDGWCEIPAGCFVMGSPEDEWGHPAAQEEQVIVTLTRGFIVHQTEVTQGDWTDLGFANPSGTQPNGKGDCLGDRRCPVGRVTWFEAVAYANLLSEQHDPPLDPCYVLHGCGGEIGSDFTCTAAEAAKPTVYECEGFRLPTDAEWEYAARAGTRSAFYSGDITFHEDFENDPFLCLPDPSLQRIGWYCHNSDDTSHPVAQLEPNAWGLFDMSGNAEEWVNDRNDGRPAPSHIDPDGTVGLHSARNTRGGSFVGWSSICRSANQTGASWNHRRIGLGFRLVRTGILDDL